MRILAIESSCDETAVSLLNITDGKLNIEKKVIASQASLHAQYGGVVPEVAARKHVEVIIPLLDKVAGKISVAEIDLIAVTEGPGLVTSLLVGIETAKTLAYIWQKPLIGVNHLSGHLYSPWLDNEHLDITRQDIFPAVSLIVSGGHTEILLLKDYGSYKILGRTRDDAAGEAFDKVAKLLDLGYPGGPEISKRAMNGDKKVLDFPRPMIDAKSYDFSFSGLKTAVRYHINEQPMLSEKDIDNICVSFQQAVVDVLTTKAERAVKEYGANSILLGGGVAANKELRKQLIITADRLNVEFHCPALEYTGDNATMIGLAGYIAYQTLSPVSRLKLEDNWRRLEPQPNLGL
ncbi:MAG: tRNA (adenosine(37)-N6)-threonylcarbamoyltransferase complex transferase subunit TsaD [Candidatus Komeilibacteria bacterium]|nr:tRNA (adenosine(37)-N6)-threonylcarbamoyltransferase complex transferase subunit TsaD [Candidatus Komeilibacteria bacterium]